MKLQIKLILFLSGSLLMLCSCASFGPDFHPNPAVLKLGQFKSSECIKLFGESNGTQYKTTSDGKYELVNYQYTKNILGSVNSRLLILEFKDGVLNAYEFSSSFDEDKTKADLQGADHLREGIGKLSQDDVTHALGEPDGKSLCPTTLSDYKDKCAKGTEIWAWFSTDKLKFGFSNHYDEKATTVYVIFDANGKVSDVQTEENNQTIYHN
jgi:hypothetical protein